MWWEVIPSGTLVMALLAAPQFIAWHWHKAVYGCNYKRRAESTHERNMISRDGRLTGAPWIFNSLEVIPDEETTAKKK